MDVSVPPFLSHPSQVFSLLSFPLFFFFLSFFFSLFLFSLLLFLFSLLFLSFSLTIFAPNLQLEIRDSMVLQQDNQLHDSMSSLFSTSPFFDCTENFCLKKVWIQGMERKKYEFRYREKSMNSERERERECMKGWRYQSYLLPREKPLESVCNWKGKVFEESGHHTSWGIDCYRFLPGHHSSSPSLLLAHHLTCMKKLSERE